MEFVIGQIVLAAYGSRMWSGMLPCNGMSLPANVSEYEPLYSIIGNTYGGTPGVNFNVPMLSAPTASKSNPTIGQLS